MVLKEKSKQIYHDWKEELSDPKFLFLFIFSAVFGAGLLTVITDFLKFNELKKGITLPDPLLETFTAIDLTVPIFIIIYGSLLIAIIFLFRHPRYIQLAFLTNCVLFLIRIFTMYIMPLDAPKGIITLTDPFVAFFGSGQTFQKDLFFSGHTGTMVVLFLTCHNKFLKRTFLILSITIAVLLVLQKAHYTVDVFIAPFLAYTVYVLVLNFSNTISNSEKYKTDF